MVESKRPVVEFKRPDLEDVYFQFPLRLVTGLPGSPEKDIYTSMANNATAYAAMAYGKDMGGMATYGAAEYLTDIDVVQNGTANLHAERLPWDVRQYLASCWALRVKLGASDVEGFKRSTKHAQDIYEKHANEGWNTRLRRDLFWDAITHEWEPLKIRVLCSIYAIIGSDKYKMIHHRLLRAVASGYPGPKEAEAAEARWANMVRIGRRSGKEPKTEQIPESTIRYWVDHLHQRGLFRTCIHQNQRWYAIAGFEDDTAFARFVRDQQQQIPKKIVVKTSDLLGK